MAGSYANIWVKPPAGESQFVIYYNNTSITQSAASVYTTFPLLGDDFTKDSVMNGSMWQNFYSGTYSFSGYLDTNGGNLMSVNNFTNCTVITRASIISISGNREFNTVVRGTDFSPGNFVLASRYTNAANYHNLRIEKAGSLSEIANEGTTSNVGNTNYYIYTTTASGSSFSDDFYGHLVTGTNSSFSTGHVGFSTNTEMAIYYILVNGYNSSAPASSAAQNGSAQTFGLATINVTPTLATTNSTIVYFNDTTANASTYYWNWSFGDGQYYSTNSAATANTTHIYSAAGVYYPQEMLLIYGGTAAYSYPATVTVSDAVTPTPTPTSNLPASYVPHNVRLYFISQQTGAKLSGLNITATPTGQTSTPSSWLDQILGLNTGLNLTTTTLNGTTGQDGSIDFLMAEIIQYNISITGTGISPQSVLVYPKDTDYQIAVTTENKPDLYYFPAYNLTVTNSSDNSNVTLGFNIYDSLNQTTNITFTVVQSGTPIYTATVPMVAGVANGSYTVLNTRASNYTWGFSANNVYGTNGNISEYQDIALRGNGSLIPTYGLSAQQRLWISIMIIFAFAGIFGSKSVKFGVILVPLVGGGFFWYIGWLPWQFGGVIAVLSCLGVMYYMREQENKAMRS